jgi:hypothetical protein
MIYLACRGPVPQPPLVLRGKNTLRFTWKAQIQFEALMNQQDVKRDKRKPTRMFHGNISLSDTNLFLVTAY